MSMRDVLAVLDHRETRLRSTLNAAVDLADAEHSRLTLVQCSEPANVYVWLCPYAVGSPYVPPEEDPMLTAAHSLARAADAVPHDIPVTTIVIPGDARRQICALIREGTFDAVVGPADLFRHSRRLTRHLRHLDVRIVPVICTRDAAAASGPARPARTGVSGAGLALGGSPLSHLP